MAALWLLKLTFVFANNKETTDKRGSGVAHEYYGISSYDGHVASHNTATSVHAFRSCSAGSITVSPG